MAIKILRSIQDGSEEAPECDAENQVRHFRGFTGVILHEFSTKIHDPETLCPVPIGRNPSKMCVFRLLSTKLQPPGGTIVTAPSGLRSRVCGQSLRPSLAPNHSWTPTTYLVLVLVLHRGAVTVSSAGPRGLFKGMTTATSGVIARFPLLLPVRNPVAGFAAFSIQ